ncbi:MAG: hypothetical protein LBL66_07675, partial [Clostridiales bacterium]|nr:hypothetical protein [Clostridiales bacterium]
MKDDAVRQDGAANHYGNAAGHDGGADKGGGERGRETNGQRVWAVTKKLLKRWFITAFGGMAFGLFATL